MSPIRSLMISSAVGAICLVVSATLALGHSGSKESSPLQEIAVDPRAPGQDWCQIIEGSGGGSNDKGSLKMRAFLMFLVTVQSALILGFDATPDCGEFAGRINSSNYSFL